MSLGNWVTYCDAPFCSLRVALPQSTWGRGQLRTERRDTLQPGGETRGYRIRHTETNQTAVRFQFWNKSFKYVVVKLIWLCPPKQTLPCSSSRSTATVSMIKNNISSGGRLTSLGGEMEQQPVRFQLANTHINFLPASFVKKKDELSPLKLKLNLIKTFPFWTVGFWMVHILELCIFL